MRAGWMRHRVTIQTESVQRGTTGEELPAWVDFKTVWAAIEPMRGTEKYSQFAAKDIAEIDTRIRIRYRSDIAPLTAHGDRVRVRWIDRITTRIFDIEGVVEQGAARKQLHLLCVEQVGADE